MKRKFLVILFIYINFKSIFTKEVFELKTQLDNSQYRFLFHTFRGFIFNSIGKTSLKTKGSFLQEKFPDHTSFPCNKKAGRSFEIPDTVHSLRPGGKFKNYFSMLIQLKKSRLFLVFLVLFKMTSQ